MRKFLPFLLAPFMLAAAPAAAAVIYSEDFEDGQFQGAVDGDLLPGGLPGGVGLFHVTQNFPASGNYALGAVYNETPGNTPNGTYAGTQIIHTIYSPEITLPGSGTITLNFDAADYGRGDNFYDRFDIGIFAGGNHYVKASTFPGYAGLGAQIYAQDSGYTSLSSIISDFAGQTVRVYIHFSLIDGFGGDAAGARLDNLSITGDLEGPVDAPEPGMIGLLGLGLAGLAAARRKRA